MATVLAITFVVPGVSEAADATVPRGRAAAPAGAAAKALPGGLTRGRIKHSVRVGVQRGAASEMRVTAVPGQDLVVLQIAGGPALTLHPQTARDLLLAQTGQAKSATRGADTAAPDTVQVPAQLQWRGLEQGVATRGATRGFLGDVLLSGLHVVTDWVRDPAADLVASQVVQRVDGQVDAGVYALRPEAMAPLKGSTPLARLPPPIDGAPQLVLVHGTFSNTAGTFGKLWSQHPQRVRELFAHYRDQVYALDHPTLGVSPIRNALTLAQACAPGARLHLVTHSRGGLVAEVLARVCAQPTLGAADLAHFKGAAYKAERDALQALADTVQSRGIRVERVVRVACPARGTLLASKRLDAYLSVFKWTLELAGIPVAPALVDFLGEVALRRADPEMIPGLAAQIPDSPLVQWLHAVDAPIAGELRVVAGDMEGDSVTSWLKTLLADGFYWTDNDLVVQTRSMYGGAPRAAGATFLLDRGGKVSHFSYFSNERTADAITSALMLDQLPPSFRVIGPLSWAGTSATGIRARRDATSDPAKPAVFVLPGILGSNLKVGGQRIWLGWRLINGLQRLDYAAGRPDGVEPDGPVGLVYDDLLEFLASTHEVVSFAFDWRRPIEEEARRLADAVSAALDARQASGTPVRIVAHSMGGLVARTMQLERRTVWQRMMAHPEARLLMLGTPNGGSWAPMQVLSADDTFGNALTAFGAPFQDRAARELMARLPGFLQLQAALLDESQGLARHDTWRKLADDDMEQVRKHNWWHADLLQLGVYQWGVPPQEVLDQAVALRKRLDAQRDTELGAFADKLSLVIGKARFTPDGIDIGNEGLVYLNAPDAGDGRVPHWSARLAGVRTWQLDCEHGSLPSHKAAFAGFLELLQQGRTAQAVLQPLPELPAAATRAAQAPVPHLRSRPSRTRIESRPPESEGQVLSVEAAAPTPAAAATSGTALRVTVVNGDLSFVRQPLLLGHYRSMRLTGTEHVVDQLIGGAMERSLKVDLYPDSPGSHQVFLNSCGSPDNPWQLPRPEAVVVVGLGEEGKLAEVDLSKTVRQAVIAWAQRVGERPGAPAHIDLAATLIGSGGAGISVSQSARMIAQGVRAANERLAGGNWPLVTDLHLIELYLDRASDAWRALQVQATAEPGHYVVTPALQSTTGALRRLLDSGYRGADYDLITALTHDDPVAGASITYRLDTKRARTEVRAQQMQGSLLRELVANASNDKNSDAQIGRTLFQLLMPMEMEPFLGGTTEMLLELDGGTAGIPWELLDSEARGGGDMRPWAIRAKLLRKLRTADFRPQVIDAHADASILVIGEPACDAALYPRLPGARAEAREVVERLAAPQALGAERVKALISPDDIDLVGADARTVINALMSRDWRIVHIAGHGEPPTDHGDPRGVVLSKGTFLGPREIRNMRVVPELVFVNCCHLAARNTQQLLRDGPGNGYDRAAFASGVAEELIKIGVRCVVAAGWAVEDGPASTFATTFYQALLQGQRFMDAVAEAREAAWPQGGNTWAAYQCYGDPDWTLRREGGDAQRPAQPLADEFAGVASPTALALALETLAVRSKFQKAPAETQTAKIRHLEARFADAWGAIGAVAEAFGVAWAAAGDVAQAIPWYERAVAANDASASIKAAEQVGNLRARLAWQGVEAAQAARAARQRNGKNAASRRAPAAAERAVVAAAEAARTPLQDAIALLEKIVALQPSMERSSLCGSAYKRLAMVEAAAGRPDAEARAIAAMKQHYQRAEALGRAAGLPDIYYPALNRMAAEIVGDAGRRSWKGFAPDELETVRDSLALKARDDPDFWSVVGLTELRTYEAIAAGTLVDQREAIEQEYSDLYRRVSAPSMWDSVLDQMRFVLPKVAARSNGTAKAAAEGLLAFVETRVRGGAPDQGVAA
jgi:CHAT domain-containing protein